MDKSLAISTILYELHGEKLAVGDGQVYYLVLNDAVVSVYADVEEEALVMKVRRVPKDKVFAYSVDLDFDEL